MPTRERNLSNMEKETESRKARIDMWHSITIGRALNGVSLGCAENGRPMDAAFSVNQRRKQQEETHHLFETAV